MRNLLSILIFLLPSSSTISTLTRAYDFTCNLYCYNNGECRHGKGKFGNYQGVQEGDVMPWEQDIQTASMYCACPIGYTGLQCEIKHVVCGDDDPDTNVIDGHTCFNGSACVKERSGDGDVYWRCECDASKSVMTASYAGKYCEHIATVFCDHEKDGSSPNFCTNGGRCKERESPDQHFVGCICPEDWTGGHCQYAVTTADNDDYYTLNNATSKTNVGRLVGFLILSVCGGTFILYCFDKRRKKKAKKRRKRAGAASDGTGEYELNTAGSSYRYKQSQKKAMMMNDTTAADDEENKELIMA